MKVILCMLLCTVCLFGGCAAQTFETLGDDVFMPVMAEASELELTYSDLREALVWDNGDSKLYMCDGYSVVLQTLEGGDLHRTVREVTGMDKDKLTLVKKDANGVSAYQCAWSAAGEGESQICRAVILDDGKYHYTVTMMTAQSAAEVMSEVWNPLLDSMVLSTG